MIIDLRFIDVNDFGEQKRVLQALIVKRTERINAKEVRTLAVWETVRLEKYDAYDGQEVEFIGTYVGKPTLKRNQGVT